MVGSGRWSAWRPWLTIGAGVALLAGAGGLFLIRAGATTRHPTPATFRFDGARPSGAVPGFDQVAFTARGRGVDTGARHCALLAVTRDQQDRGLMNRLDLGGYDGMIFHFAGPTTTQFYMKDTLIPLSIAFFDATGRFVSQLDMAPCPPATAVCPLFRAGAPYTDAIEVPQGRLGAVGIGPGSTLAVGGIC